MYKLNQNIGFQIHGYPTYKHTENYDMLYNAIILNFNLVNEKAGFNQCGYNTIWSQNGWVPSRTNIMTRVMGEPGVSHVRIFKWYAVCTNFSPIDMCTDTSFFLPTFFQQKVWNDSCMINEKPYQHSSKYIPCQSYIKIYDCKNLT